MEDVISVFGSFDQNLRMIETEYNVRVTDRDEQIHITGEAENVLYAEKAIAGLLSLAAKGEVIGEQNVRYIFRLVREGREQKIQELAGDVVCITAKGKPIKAKTLGQRVYLDAIEQNTITIGVGPAGTGKTYLAVAEAVAAFRAERVNRIILTRPAVEAGERLGFLPGDLQNKVDPYLRPLYDALFEMLGADAYAKYLERGNIEVAPLAYMRGRTLDDSFIILDGIDDIAICRLTGADVVRHALVQKIIAAYEQDDKQREKHAAAAAKKPAARKTTVRKKA